MLINVYARNIGWLFEDLKREIACYGATMSDLPMRRADAYICIRALEAKLSPRPDKTVVQIHDMNLYRLPEITGAISMVHDAQQKVWSASTIRKELLPIGARAGIPNGKLPNRPTIGYFCREVGKDGNGKRTTIFRDAVFLARKKANFDVLLIGKYLKQYASMGPVEDRAAGLNDYRRIDALFVCNPTMVSISAYEAIAAGRRVITTPRIWPSGDWGDRVLTGSNEGELSEHIVAVVTERLNMTSYAPYLRHDWAKKQVEIARSLC